MFDIKFPLVGGNTATFFFSNAQSLLVIDNDANSCTLVDSLHNNGGWKIALPAKTVTDSLRKLFTRG